MDALILSCGTGGGHNSAGRAIESELLGRGHNVKTLNPYSLKDTRIAAKVNYVYDRVAQKMPAAFGALYRLGDAYRRLPVRSPVYLINGGMRPYLAEYLAEHHFDVLVMTHLFPAEILTNMKNHGMKIPKTVFVATDYICIPFTEETDCDCYVIPSADLIPDYVRRGIPKDKLFPLGIPVHSRFRQPISREEACASLGLDPAKKHILIAGGSIGAGQIEKAVSLLLSHYDGKDADLTVICGNNKSLYDKSEKKYGRRCAVLTHTDRMPEYMKACDVFISKPGGLSSTEAAVAGIPLVQITPISGCEADNMRFFGERGMSEAVPSVDKSLPAVCDMLIGDGSVRRRMKEKQRGIIPANAAGAVCDLLEKIC